ncbi:hypothetical protein R5R35_002654 [Gryllus longicercus]|uniref:G-protein coupled receptors family 2 profile 2 domain-containing protein n=1 Tax=Gryllus longicercus TaxID=2509291 RepID=A0AAN9VW09_9ORTH
MVPRAALAARKTSRSARSPALCVAVLLAALCASLPAALARPPGEDSDEGTSTTTDTAASELDALVPAPPGRCCPSGLLRPQKAPCADWPQHAPLRCAQGYYRLEPGKYEEDRFRVDDAGRLLFGEGRDPVEPSDFCLGTVVLSDNETEDTALVCFHPMEDWTPYPRTRNLVNGVCLSVSVAFLVITLLVYAALPELHDLDGRVIMSYLASLAIADLVLAVLQFHGHHLSHVACVTQAFFLYFWLLAAFFWMNTVCFNVWRRTICLRLPLSERNLFTVYVLYGFGLPLLLLVVAIFTEHFPGSHLRPQFGVTKCWFEEEMASWAYFYGPVAVLLACNMVFFIWSVWSLWHDYTHIQVDTKLRSLRCKCCLYLKLAVLMGISWIFEIISFIAGDWPFFTYVTDVLNSLQGLLIFVLLVATRRRVLRLLVKRRPYGLAPPERWAEGPDDESEAMLPEEEPAQLGGSPLPRMPCPADASERAGAAAASRG